MELRCPTCQRHDLSLREGGSFTCPCRKKVTFNVQLWPAAHRKRELSTTATARLDDEAACYHHPHRRAQAVCVDCGILICDWCNADHREGVCLNCFAKRQENDKPEHAAQSASTRVLYDSVALGLAFIPIIILWPISVITAPLAIFYALYHWKKHPTSRIVPRSRWRYIVALIFAIPQTLAWIVFGIHLALKMTGA